MKVHGCSGRSPQHYDNDTDGEDSNSSSACSISVAASPQVATATNHQVHGTTASLGEWYCQTTPPTPDPLAGLGHFGNIHHAGATAAY